MNWKALFYKIFGIRCFNCGQIAGINGWNLICPDCAALTLQTACRKKDVCPHCGRRNNSKIEGLCFDCSREISDFEWNRSIFYYGDPLLKNLIHRYKFESNRAAGKDLCRLLKTHLLKLTENIETDLTLITPLSWKSYRKRGFNQTEWILKQAGIEYKNWLYRKPHTGHQSQLGRMSRREWIKNQFDFLPGVKEKISGKRVLVLDDIYTTGSTAGEISRILKEAGAEKVFFITYFYD